MRWAVQPGESPLFGRERGCDEFEQRVLSFDAADQTPRRSTEDDVLYVLAGRGAATIGGERVELAHGTAVYCAAGTEWQVDEADGLRILSVLVRNPLPANGSTHAVVAVDDASAGDATAGRMFRLLATPERGCASVTQFIG